MSGDLNQPSGTDVVAVVVTWNRRDLLARVTASHRRPDATRRRVVVVDNASDDGTATMLRDDFPDVDVVRCRTNTGGAGGFALGLDRALDGPVDAVWLMDDDTVPEPGALAELVVARARFGDRVPPWSPPGSCGPTAATTR